MERVFPYFFDEVPEFEARDGVMFMRWPGLEIAAPLPIAERALLLCKEALAKERSRMGAPVVRLPPR